MKKNQSQMAIPSQIHNQVQQMIEQGKAVFDFTAGDPDLRVDSSIIEAVNTAFDEEKTHYTEVAGFTEIRKKISRKLKEDNGLIYTPEQILISNGARQALFIAFSFLLEKDDEVIIPTPYWAGYSAQIKENGGQIITVDTTDDNYIFTAENFAKNITEKTKILVLNSPCNPTGAIIPREELEKIAEIAVEKDVWVISDEVYEYFTYGEKVVSIASLNDEIYQRTLTVNSGSKSFAMTGLRSGYIAGSREIIEQLTTLQAHVSSCPNTLGQVALGAGIKNRVKISRDLQEIFQARMKIAIEILEKNLGHEIYYPAGGIYLWLDVREYLKNGQNSATFCQELLAKTNVAIVPGNAFGEAGEGFVRIALTTKKEKIKAGLTKLAEFMKK